MIGPVVATEVTVPVPAPIKVLISAAVIPVVNAVSYTHLTLPTNREV